MNNTDECKLRELILNSRKPVVIRKFTQTWKCFEGSLETWCTSFDESSTELSSFERMPLKYWNAPQWERNRKLAEMSCHDFLKFCSCGEQKDWLGLNYKRAEEIPKACKEGVEFDNFGFPEAASDASFWLSSKGANTPCHYDTYGCNIVRQIYGRKSWLMFPPQSKLTVSRIPYEESSVYCSENFYSPDPQEIKKIEKLLDEAFYCILEPNDVLILPRNWWHYVESLETSLSVNAWIPLQCDLEAQIEEWIVKFLMERFAACETDDMQKYMLNPNQRNEITDDVELFAVLKHLLNERESIPDIKLINKKFPYQYLEQAEVLNILRQYPTASEVPRLSREKLVEILKINSIRFDKQLNNCDAAPFEFFKIILLNSICIPDVIQLIKQKFYQQMEREQQYVD